MRTASPAATALAVLASTALWTLPIPPPAQADWPPCGRTVTSAPGKQVSPAIATDGSSGAIVAWVDLHEPVANIFARRMLASGEADPAWPAEGSRLMTDPAALADAIEVPAFPVMIPDGAGGAIVAWQHGRAPGTGTDIFAQHVLASGAVDPAWPANGVVVCEVRGVQDLPALVGDGAGGAIVTWMDGRSSTTSVDIFAQRVLGSGTVDPAWPANGRALCTAPAPQAFPTIVSDGAGGAIVTWSDFRSSITSVDIFAQRVLASGVTDPAWPVDGRALCTAAGEQFEPQLVSDDAHGAIVAWYDSRSGINHVFAHHVLGSGVVDPAWPANGRAVTDGAFTEEFPKLAPDGDGGAIVAWQTRVNGLLRIFAQHVTSAGQRDPAWPANGRGLNASDTSPDQTTIVPDGSGGAIVAWQEGLDILAQHVLASGALASGFPPAGRVLCDLPSEQRDPVMIAAGPSGAIVAWTDTRNGTDADVFALQVLEAGTLDVPPQDPRATTFASPRPNPARGPITLRFTLGREAKMRLSIFDPSGRRVRDLASGARPAGEHALEWDLRDQDGRAVRAGLYLARLEVEGLSVVQRLLALQ
jgi:hypothetical protein